MKHREKTLALGLIVLMTVMIGGFIFFQYYARNMTTLNKTTRLLQNDLADEDNKQLEIDAGMKRVDQAKKLSLPPNVDSSRREYTALLSQMLRDSTIASTNFSP